MNYSHDTTVLLWSDDPSVSKMAKKICSSLKLNLYKVEIATDVYAFPYFFAIIDGKLLSQEMLSDLA